MHLENVRSWQNVLAPSSQKSHEFYIFPGVQLNFLGNTFDLSDYADEEHESQLARTCGLYYKSCTIVIYDRNHSLIIGPVL